MIETVLGLIVGFIHTTITTFGLWGVTLLMAIESCNIPLPSEAIMPFAGYMLYTGQMENFHLTAVFGAIGCVLGSIPSYYLGYFGGRSFVEKYGKYFLVSKKDLQEADRWVEKYGDWAFFICRMLPVVRTFISLPAGILRSRKRTFFAMTFVGSLIWCYVLLYAGLIMGENFELLQSVWHKFDAVIIGVVCVLGGVYVYHHFKNLKDS